MTALSTEDDVAQIRRNEQARLDAMCSRDAATLGRLLAPDFTYTHSNGSIDGKDQIIGRVGDPAVRYRDGRFLSLEVRLYGDIAVVNGHFNLSVEAHGHSVDIDSRSLSVWRRSESWQQVATASTPILPPPSAAQRKVLQ